MQADGLAEAIETYKIDLGRFHKILLTEVNDSEANS